MWSYSPSFRFSRHSGASRNLRAAMDSGFRRSDGSTPKPPEKERCRGSVPFQAVHPSRPCAPTLRRHIAPGYQTPLQPNPARPRKSRKIGATHLVTKYILMPYYRPVGENPMLGLQTITATTISNQVATVIGNLTLNALFGAFPWATPSATAGHAIGMENSSTNRAPASGRRR